ncbi:succinate dehydrogenase assembly factor 2 [Thiomonas sp.]|jgi:antitoxin CptB|uniref:FAD assembly factor SdhE n=1 Tax=Thiomonas sp. TaxID=2047785 RepID=UPI002610DC6A|nr:succinate dehydrogenase assembly factor 2 [Thiomonas sp.]
MTVSSGNPGAPEDHAAALRRLRWRARRGLLENDLLFTRFFARHGDSLEPAQAAALGELLELDDNTLLALLLGHIEPPAQAQAAQRLGLLDMLRD